MSTIQVLGRSDYVEQAEAYGIDLLFEENPNKCDPQRGFISLEEQVKHFSEALQVKGVAWKDFSRLPKRNTETETRHWRYRFTHIDPSKISLISSVCADQVIQVENTFTIFPEHRYEDEDEQAIRAFQDAERKAKTIARKLGKRISKVVNVDDDTSLRFLLDIEEDQDSANAASFEELLEFLVRLEGIAGMERESQSPSRSRSYSLLVTFEMK
ncbi:MAG: SIMPL domain-containing protein [Saprospiraceae bacterium]|nr:SIMPL domain-containing protein [Saprospiraceae bacterium]